MDAPSQWETTLQYNVIGGVHPQKDPWHQTCPVLIEDNVDGLVQERRNSSTLAVELRLSCINPLMYGLEWGTVYALTRGLFLVFI